MNIDSPNITDNITMPFYWGVTGSFATAATFTFAADDDCCHRYLESLFTCRSAEASSTFDNATDKFTLNAHGQLDGTVCYLTSGTPPTNFALNTPYYIVNKAANDFQLSLTPGGAAITSGDDGTNIKVKFLRFGYISSLVNTLGTVTATVLSNTDLVAGDNTFRISPYLKVDRFMYEVRTGVPEVVVDASNAQGMYHSVSKPSYLLNISAGMITAAATTCTINVYQDANSCIASTYMNCNQAFAGGTALLTKRPDLVTYIPLGSIITMRVMAQTGAAGKGILAKIPIVPISRFINN